MAQKRYAKMQLTVKRQTKGRKLNHILCTGRATVVPRMSLFHFLKARKPRDKSCQDRMIKLMVLPSFDWCLYVASPLQSLQLPFVVPQDANNTIMG